MGLSRDEGLDLVARMELQYVQEESATVAGRRHDGGGSGERMQRGETCGV